MLQPCACPLAPISVEDFSDFPSRHMTSKRRRTDADGRHHVALTSVRRRFDAM